MPSTSYTQPLWNVQATGMGIQAGPFVPAGFLWVVRDVTFCPPAGAGPNRTGGILLREGQTHSVLWGVGPLEAPYGLVYHSELRQALLAGNNLELVSPLPGWQVAVTGYVFTA